MEKYSRDTKFTKFQHLAKPSSFVFLWFLLFWWNKQEREQYEYVIVEGTMVHKKTGDLLDTNRKSQGSKWIFVMSTCKKLYAGEVRYTENQ